MRDIVLLVVSLSLSGSLLALLLFAARPLWRGRLSKTFQYYIWALVVLRLLVPLSPSVSLMGSLFAAPPIALEEAAPAGRTPPAAEMEALPQAETPARVIPVEVPREMPEETDPGTPAAIQLSFDSVRAAAAAYVWWVWPVLALLLFLRKIIGYRRFAVQLSAGLRPVTDSALLDLYGDVCVHAGVARAPALYHSDTAASPLLVGVLRPRILLPDAALNPENLRLVLLHELTHLRRGDLVYKWAVQLAVCLHWFNPLVHLMSREIERQCELSCDERVLRLLDQADRRAYGETLLAAVLPGALPPAAGSLSMSEDAGKLKERLEAILHLHTPTRAKRALSAVLTAVLACGAVFTGAYAASSTPEEAPRQGHVPQQLAAEPSANDVVGTWETGEDSAWIFDEITDTRTIPVDKTVKTLVLRATDVNLRVYAEGDTSVTAGYRGELHTVTYEVSGGVLTLDIRGRRVAPGEDAGFLYNMMGLKIPGDTFEAIRVEADGAGVSLPALPADMDIVGENSAFSVDVAGDYRGSLSVDITGSSGSVQLPVSGGNYTLDIRNSGSAVAVQGSLPTYDYAAHVTAPYRAVKGGGDAQISLDVKNSAVSVSDRKRESFTGQSYTISAMSARPAASLSAASLSAPRETSQRERSVQVQGTPQRLTLAQLPEELSPWITRSAGEPDIHVRQYKGHYYVYIPNLPGGAFFRSEADSDGNWTVTVTDKAGSDAYWGSYILLSVPLCQRVTAVYGDKQVTHTSAPAAGSLDSDERILALLTAGEQAGSASHSHRQTTVADGFKDDFDITMTEFTGAKMLALFGSEHSAIRFGFTITADVEGEFLIVFVDEHDNILRTATTHSGLSGSRPVELPAGSSRMMLVGDGATGWCTVELS